MPSIWSYSDSADRGYGLFKRRIFKALRQSGWETFLAEAPLLESSSKAILRDHLFAHPCDWIFLINQTAVQLYEYLSLPPDRIPLSCKKLIWFLDNPQFFITQTLEPQEYVFSFDETYLPFMQNCSPSPPGFFPLAADQESAGKIVPDLECAVCFVGGVIDQGKRRQYLSAEMIDYINLLVEKKLSQRGNSFEELSLQYPIAPGKQIQITNEVAHFLYWEANNRYRLRVLESLMDFDLRIYGNEDWEILLAASPLKSYFKGPADPIKDLPHLFASAKINLNLHSIQCLGSMNQRDFNAPICDGFLLSDWVSAAGKYFVPSVEAVYWKDIADLRHKIHYYLEHKAERRKIIAAGKARVLRDHTYPHRVQELLSVLPNIQSHLPR